jgi:hypothetical protein
VLLGGIWFFVLGLFIMSSGSKYAPRVEIEDTFVLIHNHIFRNSQLINLKEITKIKFGSYEITFIDKKGDYNTYRINTRKSAESRRIKEELRKKAAYFKIEIQDEIAEMMR